MGILKKLLGGSVRAEPLAQMTITNQFCLRELRFSPDGKLLVASDGSLICWDVQSGAKLWSLSDEQSPFFAFCFSPDGGRIAVGHNDGHISIWPLPDRNGPEIISGAHPFVVSSIEWSPDGKYLISASDSHVFMNPPGEDTRVLVWDANTLTLIRELRFHNAGVCSMSLSSDSTLLATGSRDGKLSVSEIATGRLRSDFQRHTQPVTSTAVASPTLIMSATKAAILLQHLDTGEEVARYSSAWLKYSICGVALSRTASMIVAAGSSAAMGPGFAVVWDLRTGKSKSFANTTLGLTRIAVSSISDIVAVGDMRDAVFLWRLELPQTD
jgi:WD40 repeat protein